MYCSTRVAVSPCTYIYQSTAHMEILRRLCFSLILFVLQKYTAAEMLIVAEASDGSAYAPASFMLGARFQLTRLLLEANVAHQEARLAPLPTHYYCFLSIRCTRH